MIPSLLTLFSGLKRAYAARAAAENSDDDSDEESDDDDLEVEELGSDEDDIDDDGVQYLEKLQKARTDMEASSEDCVSFNGAVISCASWHPGFLTSRLFFLPPFVLLSHLLS